MSTAIVWFRRDLRVADHPALARAAEEFDRVVALFVVDPALLHGRGASASRTAFMLGCLRDLDASLRKRAARSRSATAARRTSCSRWPGRPRRRPSCGRATSPRTPARATRA